MPLSGNRAKPRKTTEEAAAELRQRLERQLGPERSEAIWRDPTSVDEVVEDEGEAASVAGLLLQAWKDLPEEERSGRPRRRSRFRRGLRLALIGAVAAWAISVLRRGRQEREEV